MGPPHPSPRAAANLETVPGGGQSPPPSWALRPCAREALHSRGMATETTLVLIKPDAVRRGLVAEILGRFERRGFRIRGLRQLVLTRERAERHYAEHEGKP